MRVSFCSQIDADEETNIDRSISRNIFRDFYLNFIDELPNYNSPDVLGLHSNVEINYLTQTAQTICATLLEIQPEQREIDDYSHRQREFDR